MGLSQGRDSSDLHDREQNPARNDAAYRGKAWLQSQVSCLLVLEALYYEEHKLTPRAWNPASGSGRRSLKSGGLRNTYQIKIRGSSLRRQKSGREMAKTPSSITVTPKSLLKELRILREGKCRRRRKLHLRA
jgi:hypothetical protein